MSLSTTSIAIDNTTDKTNFERKSSFQFTQNSPLTIRSDMAMVELANDNDMVGFSGYYPRLVPGENTLNITATRDLYLIVQVPIARWIT